MRSMGWFELAKSKRLEHSRPTKAAARSITKTTREQHSLEFNIGACIIRTNILRTPTIV